MIFFPVFMEEVMRKSRGALFLEVVVKFDFNTYEASLCLPGSLKNCVFLCCFFPAIIETLQMADSSIVSFGASAFQPRSS